MARAQKLKVFRTPIGFHDAYVAAPSQKAALEAWGADSNLFATGSAERVEDPELMREPLARPGQVIRRLRGTLAEHVAALPRDANRKPRQAKSPTSAEDAEVIKLGEKRPRPPKLKRRPARTALDRAEAALAAVDEEQAEAGAELSRRQAELDRERRKLEDEQNRKRERLQKRVDAARERYETAMRAWRAT